MDPQMVGPLLKDTPNAVVHWIQIWWNGWPHLWRDKIWRLSLQHGDSVTCTVNGMISVTSTLLHQVRDVHAVQRSKFASMISIHLQSWVQKMIKNPCIFVKVIAKNQWHLFMWTRCIYVIEVWHCRLWMAGELTCHWCPFFVTIKLLIWVKHMHANHLHICLQLLVIRGIDCILLSCWQAVK